MSATTTKDETKNGTAPKVEDIEFPVGDYREAAVHLRRPFTARAVKFKIQSKYGNGQLIVAYIDARLVVERLNLVCPHLWHDDYQQNGKALICRLTVDGITREDVGTGYTDGKALYSDSLKRAGVKFGVGVSLYATPKIILSGTQHLRESGKNVYLTDAGEAHCRKLYSEWLKTEGSKSFGPELDHGDAEDSVGDPDVPATPPQEDAPPGVAPIDGDRAARLVELFKDIPVAGEDDDAKLKRDLKVKLGSIGAKSGSGIGATFAKLTPGQADEVDSFLSDELGKREES